MTEPVRVQRTRVAGWCMPPNTIYVGRPGRWGNPYDLTRFGLELSLTLYRNSLTGIWSPDSLRDRSDEICDEAYRLHHEFLKRMRGHPLEQVIDLRGKNLACWCALDVPCHADILLKAANPKDIYAE
jgi:hypothetical protein